MAPKDLDTEGILTFPNVQVLFSSLPHTNVTVPLLS